MINSSNQIKIKNSNIGINLNSNSNQLELANLELQPDPVSKKCFLKVKPINKAASHHPKLLHLAKELGILKQTQDNNK